MEGMGRRDESRWGWMRAEGDGEEGMRADGDGEEG